MTKNCYIIAKGKQVWKFTITDYSQIELI